MQFFGLQIFGEASEQEDRLMYQVNAFGQRPHQ